jgi:hypothetical protein
MRWAAQFDAPESVEDSRVIASRATRRELEKKEA